MQSIVPVKEHCKLHLVTLVSFSLIARCRFSSLAQNHLNIPRGKNNTYKLYCFFFFFFLNVTEDYERGA